MHPIVTALLNTVSTWNELAVALSDGRLRSGTTFTHEYEQARLWYNELMALPPSVR